MVRLDRIYTRTGDDGTTALGNGRRVPKQDPRVEAYGTVDELNAALGLLAGALKGRDRALIVSVQNDLFDAGADLCVPPGDAPHARRALRVAGTQVARLEREIDRRNAVLPPLTSFVLPGGSPAAAWTHLARTVCRRAERRLATLAVAQPVNPEIARYLNRLSDLLFVLARALSRRAGREATWVPGRFRAAR